MCGSYYISEKIVIGFEFNRCDRLYILEFDNVETPEKWVSGIYVWTIVLIIFGILSPNLIRAGALVGNPSLYKWKGSDKQNEFMILNHFSKKKSNSISVFSEHSRF